MRLLCAWLSVVLGTSSTPSPPPACPESAADLPLPAWVSTDDPRLGEGALVVVTKAARKVMFFSGGARAEGACWPAGLGFEPEGHKEVRGDGRTPEGFYGLSDRPGSKFYGAMLVHYPNAEDARAGRAAGRVKQKQLEAIEAALDAGRAPPQTTPLGGQILIHGGGSASDWTLGCVGMDNDDLDALRALVGKEGQLLILP